MHSGQLDPHQTQNYEVENRAIKRYLDKRKKHPRVMTFTDDLYIDQRPDDELNDIEKAEKYAKYGLLFTWSLQQSTVGQESANQTICSNQTGVMYDNIQKIRGQYKRAEYGEAGTSTYLVLKAIDPVVFSCYFAIYEIDDGFRTYRETIQ